VNVNDRVEQAWKRYEDTRHDGKRFRPLGRRVVIETYPLESRTQSGLIHLAPSASSMYAGPMHLRRIKGFVIATGPDVRRVKIGETVLFVRRDFARLAQLENGIYTGFVDESHILGYPTPEDIYLE
jgi:co-chaperonin GroES (HSP10)